MKELLSGASFSLPSVGDVLSGKIINASKASIIIDLGPLGTGIVYPGNFYDSEEMKKRLKSGQEVKAILLELENEEGYRELSLKQAQLITSWQTIREKFEKGEVISAPVININKGGLIIEVDGIQGFMPLSQLSKEHYPQVENGDMTKIIQHLQKFRGQEFKMKIIDHNESEGKLIVSEKAIDEDLKKEYLEHYSVGEIVDVEITEVTDFGAFVKLSKQGETSDIEGLIRKADLSWDKVEDPRDFLEAGQKVKVKIIAIEGSKVFLSLRDLEPNPWADIKNSYQIGQKIEGKITKASAHGFEVELKPGILGVIPNSEIGKDSSQYEEGKECSFAIIDFDSINQRIVLTPSSSDSQ